MHTIHEFDNIAEATKYRETSGCGGWIYRVNDNGTAILYPWQWTPSMIFNHPTARLDGALK